MANTVLINTLVESGVNTESRLLKISCDVAGILNIPYTLQHYPVWVQVIQAKEVITALPAAARVLPIVAENPLAPNGTTLYYAFGFNTVAVYLTGPSRPGETEIVHFTLHLGRTHSRAR
jgi:hypothetical protein